MKLLYVFLLTLNHADTLPAHVIDTIIHHYYFMWSGNHSPQVSAWGEDDFECNHKPTKAELLNRVRRVVSKTDPAYKYLKIEELIYFENEDAFWKWKAGYNSPQQAYQIFLHQ